MAAAKQDSNRTGLAIAEEISLKVLPGLNGADAVWYGQEPNTYSDFGGELTLVAREAINASRQKQKGGVVDLDASGGYNQDFTKSNFQRILQGFFFADARQKASNATLAVLPTTVALIDAGEVSFDAALAKAVLPGALVFMSGFDSPLNNGLKSVTTGGVNDIIVAGTADDADPNEEAKVSVVGHTFAAGDVALTFPNNVPTLAATAFDFTTLGLTPGEWVFLGGDVLASRFSDTDRGYARVKDIAAKALTFDKTTWTFAAVAGAGKTIQMFFGTVIRNEKEPDLIKRRTYSIERTLGRDDDGPQAEYLDGAVPNEFTLNVPQADKLNADLSFVAVDNKQNRGSVGLRPGNRVSAPGEALYNTSSNIYRLRMSIVDAATSSPSPLFAYVTEATIAINNGVTPDKAVGVLGAFDTSADDFDVSGDVEAYFSTVQAVQAVRNNADVTLDMIVAAANAGFVLDIPLLALGGGRLNVEKGQSIKIPLEMSAAENPAGYTLLINFFDYLPAIAMPV